MGDQNVTLTELQSKALSRLDWTTIITPEESKFFSDEEKAVLAEYFSRFLPPLECPGCGRTHSFTWGIQHGAGHCFNCHYPARAYHYDIGPIKSLVLTLFYHPDELREARE